MTAKKKKIMAWVGEGGGVTGESGGHEASALFFFESSLKTTDTWYRIPLRVQEGGQRFASEQHTHAHTHRKLNTQPHKRQHKRGEL